MTDSFAKATDAITGKLSAKTILGVGVMMLLGEYRFSISNAAYQTLKRQTHHQWQAINRLGREPALQYTGESVETLHLEGAIYPQYQGGLSQLTLMRAEAQFGVPLLLIAGNGFAFGRWCIASITENQSVFLSDGTPRKIEFSLSLKRYGEEGNAGIKGIIKTVKQVSA